MIRVCVLICAVAATAGFIGCTEIDPSRAQPTASQPPSQNSGSSGGRSSTGYGGPTNSALSGAKQAAQNTVDRNDAYQRRLQEALDDN